MEEFRPDEIETCKSIIKMFQEMMIEHQANIRHHSERIEVENNRYGIAKRKQEEYLTKLKQLEGATNND